MLKTFMEKDMAKLFVINIATIAALCGALTAFGAFPWAMPKDIDSLEKQHNKNYAQLEKKYDENNLELQKKYDQMITLKNQDNLWYRELEIKVATMQADINHMKGDIQEIKAAVVRGR